MWITNLRARVIPPPTPVNKIPLTRLIDRNTRPPKRYARPRAFLYDLYDSGTQTGCKRQKKQANKPPTRAHYCKDCTILEHGPTAASKKLCHSTG